MTSKTLLRKTKVNQMTNKRQYYYNGPRQLFRERTELPDDNYKPDPEANGRSIPITVDIFKLFNRKPAHQHCNLVIHNSKKNLQYRGLYCKEHDHWLTWINPDQEEYLNSLGIPAIESIPTFAEIQT